MASLDFEDDTFDKDRRNFESLTDPSSDRTEDRKPTLSDVGSVLEEVAGASYAPSGMGTSLFEEEPAELELGTVLVELWKDLDLVNDRRKEELAHLDVSTNRPLSSSPWLASLSPPSLLSPPTVSCLCSLRAGDGKLPSKPAEAAQPMLEPNT